MGEEVREGSSEEHADQDDKGEEQRGAMRKGGEERGTVEVEFWGRKVEGEVKARTLMWKKRRQRSITCLFNVQTSANISLDIKDVRSTSH